MIDITLADYSLCGPLNGHSHPLLMDDGTHDRRCAPLAGSLGASSWMQLLDASPARPDYDAAPMCISPFQQRPVLQCTVPRSTGYTPPLHLDFDAFVLLYEQQSAPFGLLDADRRTNLRNLLTELCLDEEIGDLRWIAYMLATTIHEARSAATQWQVTWAPVEESGGASMDYGALQVATGWDGKPVNAAGQRLPASAPKAKGSVAVGDGFYRGGDLVRRRYYGRGYVQITHQDNYRAMGDALGIGNELVAQPQRALEFDIAYRIMSHGMRHGSFRGRRRRDGTLGYHGGYKLADFINEDTDYVQARQIINGDTSKHGAMIAGYAERFESILQNSRAD